MSLLDGLKLLLEGPWGSGEGDWDTSLLDVLKEGSSTVWDVEGGEVTSTAAALDQFLPTQDRQQLNITCNVLTKFWVDSRRWLTSWNTAALGWRI